MRFLRVKVPYHSHYMDPLRTELEQSLEGSSPAPASLPLYSTVTGALVDGRDLDAAYWWRNVREPVYFAAAAGAMIEDGYTTFLELSPHPVLSASIGECLALKDRPGLAVPSLRRQEEERALMLGALGALYGAGYTPAGRTSSARAGNWCPCPPTPGSASATGRRQPKPSRIAWARGPIPSWGGPSPGPTPPGSKTSAGAGCPTWKTTVCARLPSCPAPRTSRWPSPPPARPGARGPWSWRGWPSRRPSSCPRRRWPGATAVQTTLDPETGRLRVYSREGTRAGRRG